MVLKSFHLVLKKYEKWFLKRCGNPVQCLLGVAGPAAFSKERGLVVKVFCCIYPLCFPTRIYLLDVSHTLLHCCQSDHCNLKINVQRQNFDELLG